MDTGGRGRDNSRDGDRRKSTGGRGGRAEKDELSGVNPRWLRDNRARSPRSRTSVPLPRARPPTKPGVTTETRSLKPLPRRPQRRTNSSQEARSSRETEESAPWSSGASSSLGSRPFMESHGVDAWRFLLGLDVESFEAGIDVIPASQPLLPEYARAMIEETIAHYSPEDQAIVTVAFVRFLRLLMAEVMMSFERGVAAAGARNRNEVLVEVEAEEDGDGSSLMQRTLTGQLGKRTGHNSWLVELQKLQVEHTHQETALRNSNIAGLQACLRQAPGIREARRMELEAVLVAMSDEESSEVAVCNVTWQLQWWNRLFPPTSSCEPAGSMDNVVFEPAATGQQEGPANDVLEELAAAMPQ